VSGGGAVGLQAAAALGVGWLEVSAPEGSGVGEGVSVFEGMPAPEGRGGGGGQREGWRVGGVASGGSRRLSPTPFSLPLCALVCPPCPPSLLRPQRSPEFAAELSSPAPGTKQE
jgi:hypothetical protein